MFRSNVVRRTLAMVLGPSCKNAVRPNAAWVHYIIAQPGFSAAVPERLLAPRDTIKKGETTMMAPQDLESELKKEPFQPFRIVTTNGKTYDIREKDRPLLLVGKRTVIIGLRVPETDPYFDRYEVVSLVHIIRLEPIPIAQQQSA